MKSINISIEMQLMQYDEMNPEERMLVDNAKEATYNSYAPYSNFCVGAALLLDDGTVVPGCNQENSSYPCGICAERSAVFAAGASHPDKKILAICVAARDSSGNFTTRPISPCGACRQVLSETEDRCGNSMKVMLYGTEGTYILKSAKDLLPVSFDNTYL